MSYESDNTTKLLTDDLQKSLKEAYTFFELMYPTTESAINEAYYNKQRQIREDKSGQQYTLIYKAKELRDVLIENIDTPLSGNIFYDSEEEVEAESTESLFVKEEDNSFSEEEFLAWEDAVSVNKLEKPVPQKQKKRHRGRLYKFFILISAICALTILIPYIKTKLNIYIPPGDNLIYSALKERGIELSDGQTIFINEENIESFAVNSKTVTAFKGKAITSVNITAKTKIGEVTCVSWVIFDNVNKQWEYENQYSKLKVFNSDLIGTWEGPYKVSKDSTTISHITLQINEKTSDNTYLGVCRITAQNKKSGSYEAEINVTQNGEVNIKGLNWIDKPTFFIMEDFKCSIDIEGQTLLPVNGESSIFELIKSDN